MKIVISAVATTLMLVCSASAQNTGMPKMDHGQTSAPGQPQASGMDHGKMAMDRASMMSMMNDPANPFAASEMEMHMKMIAAKSGDVSERWTRKMIEHHRGAIAMSRVALAQASDVNTKRMAQMTIQMQEKDVASLQRWLRSHGKPSQ